ncbi:MAG: BatA and WFA domain-containing protein [Gemmatimonadota bacterium]|nr:BatA and WFA domain-containing protein [Gemmatimonadota bacterium]
MGFLNPLFLLAGVAVLVPVILHLFYRQESKTFTFPAIRYLLRTEKDHARQIRTQQLLLLLLRVAAVVLLVILGARIHMPGPGGSHDPTALALVLDNSLSATIIENGRRRLDTLKAVARMSVEAASYDDVIWVVRAGSPWEVAVPVGLTQAALAIEETGPSHGRGDLSHAIARARALVAQSDLPRREVHVFTDLQATAFSEPAGGEADIPVIVFAAPSGQLENRAIDRVSIGGGLPPLQGRRAEAAVSISEGSADDTVGVRLYVGGQVRAAARAPSGATVRLPMGPFPSGRVDGYAEIDPDPLTGDDRHFFSFMVRDPTPVATVGPTPFFLAQALAVLAESERISLGGVGRAATLINLGGEGLQGRAPSQSVLVVPLSDPARLPALNRRLAEAGIPYRYQPGPEEGARIAQSDLPLDLEGLDIRRFYRVVSAESADNSSGSVTATDRGGGTNPVSAGDGSVAMLSTGDPWLLTGVAPTGPYILLASPLDEQSTSLPVSAAMIPLLEWVIERRFGDAAGVSGVTAGTSFRPSPLASAVRGPDGTVKPVDGDQPFLETAAAGIYQVLAGDSVLESIPVNPPAVEGQLAPASRGEVRRAVRGVRDIVDDASAWSRHIFRAGRGPEPWRPLLAIVLALLVLETVVAASRALRTRRPGA